MNLINKDELVSVLKKIPLHDLSDGKNLCVVIFKEDLESAIRGLANAVVLDAVPVVRCKDCVHRHWTQEPEHGKTVHYCDIFEEQIDDNFFCGKGERNDT